MTDIRKMLSPEEREEYDALLHDAGYDKLAKHYPSKLIGGRMHMLLAEAVQAKKTWAEYVLADDALAGHLTRFKTWDKRRDVIQVKHGSVIVPHAAVVGVRRREKETGKGYWQQASLLRELTFDELADVIRDANGRIAAERITISIALRLLTLQERCPEADGPSRVAELLGLDLEDYLLSESA